MHLKEGRFKLYNFFLILNACIAIVLLWCNAYLVKSGFLSTLNIICSFGLIAFLFMKNKEFNH